MKIGFVGCGKLGMPAALAFERVGRHQVLARDPSEEVSQALRERRWPHREDYVSAYLKDSGIRNVPLAELVDFADILFVCVQTPHAPEYDGSVRVPRDRRDFDYTALARAAGEVGDLVRLVRPDRPPVVAVISTVLPGTTRRVVLPRLAGVPVAYNPAFAAMGTVVEDVLNPEFVLLGSDDDAAFEAVKRFYATLHDRPVVRMSVESAELTKVAYNTWISAKIVLANTVMEVCHKVPGCDVDDVTGALKRATNRIVSGRYMNGGVGDGGGCHPRDNIAMSWLAEELGLSHNLFDQIMLARENQAVWLASLVQKHAAVERDKAVVHLPVVILGKAYKPNTNLTAGSCAVLVHNILKEWGVVATAFDPFVDGGRPQEPPRFRTPAAFLVATRHDCFRDYEFPAGSVVVDPFRYIPARPGVTVVPVGRWCAHA